MENHKDDFLSGLEAIGENEVQKRITQGEFGLPDSPMRSKVESWLRLKELVRNEAREEEALSIARMALSNSCRANTIAVIAIIFSVAATIITTIITLLNKP